MVKYNLECFTKIFEIKPHDLIIPDKCTLPQVRNAMIMNDNIKNNYNNMVKAQVGSKIATLLAVGLIFKLIEPNITRLVKTVKSKDKEVKEDQNNKEEE